MLPICIAKLSHNTPCANRAAWLEWLLNHPQWWIWFIVIGQAKNDLSTVYYFSDATTVGCGRFCLYDISTFNISTNGKQGVLKQPKANTDLLYFSALSYYRIIVLTCPDNKSARNQPKSCMPAMHNHTNHNDARPILFQLKSSLPFSLFQFVWRLESTTTKSLLRHLHCRGSPLFKSRTLFKMAGQHERISSLCSWAGVSEQITNNVLFWLCLLKI